MSNFINPCPSAKLTSKFGWRTILKKKEWHQGIDLAQPGTVPVLAAADGEVIRVGPLSSYGNVVMISHIVNGKRMDTNYAHLRDNSICVKVGQKVKQGQQIALMGNTGRSTGQHLHFEIHNGPWCTGQPNAVDPWQYINEENVSSTSGKTLYLPKTVSSWAVYPTDKAPEKKNAAGFLNPEKFGGLNYKILANPQKDVYTIQTSNFGKVNIYAAVTTGAIIK